MCICNKCKGLLFKGKFKPEDFFVGSHSSKMWIIGLNPKESGKGKYKTKKELITYFNDKDKRHSYFNDFEKVSPMLYKLLGKKRGVGHTDIVKCYSKEWPPKKCKLKNDEIIENCKIYLIKQLRENTPKLIVCNGSPVSKAIQDIIIPLDKKDTYYIGKYNNKKITVVLSGFIGRIDDYAKRRLGLEIERLMKRLNIYPKRCNT